MHNAFHMAPLFLEGSIGTKLVDPILLDEHFSWCICSTNFVPTTKIFNAEKPKKRAHKQHCQSLKLLELGRSFTFVILPSSLQTRMFTLPH